MQIDYSPAPVDSIKDKGINNAYNGAKPFQYTTKRCKRKRINNCNDIKSMPREYDDGIKRRWAFSVPMPKPLIGI